MVFFLLQIYIRVRSDEWNVYRRYTEFYELHCKLKKAFKSIKNLDFPPKRAFRRKVGMLLIPLSSFHFYVFYKMFANEWVSM